MVSAYFSAIEYLNAMSMVPGILLSSIFIPNNPYWYCPVAYTLVCLASISYHLSKAFYGYQAFTHRLDIVAQQLCIISSSIANPHHNAIDTLVILMMTFATLLYDINTSWERHAVHTLNFLGVIMAIIPLGNPQEWVNIFSLAFMSFILSYIKYFEALHIVFHIAVHYGMAYYWKLIM